MGVRCLGLEVEDWGGGRGGVSRHGARMARALGLCQEATCLPPPPLKSPPPPGPRGGTVTLAQKV